LLPSEVQASVAPPTISSGTVGGFQVLAIGASTGGPGAIVRVLRALPPRLSVPILFVLHIDALFATAFAEWLESQTSLRVSYASEGQPINTMAGQVVMAPPGRHLTVVGGRLRLDLEPPRHSCRPSIDVLFESLAREYGRNCLACLLTGMGRDGAA